MGQRFLRCVAWRAGCGSDYRSVWVPTLKPGAVAIADNCQPQRQGHARRILRADARLLLLSKYSSDLNPIEQGFAKLRPPWRPGESGNDGR